MLKMLNAKLECHMAKPHALPHEVSTFIYISLKSHVYAWIHLKIYKKMDNIIPIYNLNTINSHSYILFTF